jgi:hypothetical protein
MRTTAGSLRRILVRFGTAIAFFSVVPIVLQSPAASPPDTCKRDKLFVAQRVVAWFSPSNSNAFFYKSGMAIDADGALRAYHPNDRSGLDALAHAGHPGNWWALVTDNGKPTGVLLCRVARIQPLDITYPRLLYMIAAIRASGIRTDVLTRQLSPTLCFIPKL